MYTEPNPSGAPFATRRDRRRAESAERAEAAAATFVTRRDRRRAESVAASRAAESADATGSVVAEPTLPIERPVATDPSAVRVPEAPTPDSGPGAGPGAAPGIDADTASRSRRSERPTSGPVTRRAALAAERAGRTPSASRARPESEGAAAPKPTEVPVSADPAVPGGARPAGRRAAVRTTASRTDARTCTIARLPSMPRVPVVRDRRRGRRVVVTASTIAATLFVAVASPQSALAQPTTSVVGTVADAGAQRLAASGVAPRTDGRDGYSVGVVDETVSAGTVVSSAVRPVDGTIPTAGGFGGRRVAGCSACSTDHQGLDFAAATGTPVHSVLSGVVVSAGWEGGYGQSVVVRHADGLSTRYGHLSRIDVRVGQTVATGTVVGRVGSTGISTGSHLHFEVIVRGVPVDPAPWLRVRGLL